MKAKALIFLLTGIVLTLAYLIDKPVTYADTHTFQVYEVTIQGTVGGRAFTRRGALFTMPAQSDESADANKNQVNFWLVSGNPSGAAGQGAIWLATYSGFYGGRGDETFAVVSAQSNSLSAQFTAAPFAQNANAFSLSSNRIENASQQVMGQVDLQLQLDGTVDGTINLLGLNPASQTFIDYTATLSGNYTGDHSW